MAISIGITGGICCGKSEVLQMLANLLGTEAFSADQIVHDLYRSDKSIYTNLVNIFGSDIFNENQEVNRSILRKIIFASPEKKHTLEALIHPRVREVWLMHRERCVKNGRHFLIEIPLLYETDAHKQLDMVIVVAASATMQIERLSSRRGLSLEESSSILQAQSPMLEKIAKANLVMWNDGSIEQLYQQAAYAAALIKSS